MNTRHPWLVRLGLLLILAVGAAGCSAGAASPGTNSGHSPDGKPAKAVRIGYQKNGPLLILKQRGNLEERLKPLGYTVEWFEFQAGPALLEALNAGSIDLGRTGDAPPVFAQAAGSSLVYVGAGSPKAKGSGILVPSDSAIQSLADLKGKTVGFAKGSSSHYLIVKALAKAGLAFEDIRPAYLQPGDARIAFEQGQIDAWVVWDPYTADAELSAGGRLLTTGEGLSSDRDFFLASEAFASKHEDAVTAFLEEAGRACDWANEHPKELTELLSPVLGIPAGSMRAAIDRREYGVTAITGEIIQEQQEIADQFYALKLIPGHIRVADRIYAFKTGDPSK